jgi:hypothetical protein
MCRDGQKPTTTARAVRGADRSPASATTRKDNETGEVIGFRSTFKPSGCGGKIESEPLAGAGAGDTTATRDQ